MALVASTGWTRARMAGSWRGRLLNGTVRIWDLATRKAVAVLSGHQGAVNSVGFSPDGHLLVTGGRDATARVWDWRAGRQLVILRGHRRDVGKVQFLPDGGHVLSAGLDGTIRIWECDVCGPPAEVLALARRRSPGALTPEERQRFVSG